MQDNYENYLERIQGIILEHNYNGYGQLDHERCILKILANSPFNAEITITMNVDTWNKYVNYSALRYWRGFFESHPENYDSQDFYCNLQEGKFYMVSTIDKKKDPVWRESSFADIINVSHSAWRFSWHIHAYDNRFHTGQTCEFSAYAIDGNDRPYKPSTIDKDFSKYDWIYEPLSFTAGEITSESVEHLITQMQIPQPVAAKIIQKCKSDIKESRKEIRRRWCENIKTRLSNLQGHSIVGFFRRFRQEVASPARSYRGSFRNRKSKISYN